MRKVITVIIIVFIGNLINTLFDIKYIDVEYPIQWFGLKFFQLLFDGFGLYYLFISMFLITVYEFNFHKEKLNRYLLFALLIVILLGGVKLLTFNHSDSIQSVARIATFSLIFSLSYFYFNSRKKI